MRFLSLALAASIVACLFVPMAEARPATINYQLPSQDCDGQPIAASDIDQMEIYVSAAPIPASDVGCPPAGSPVDAPPSTFSTRVDVPPGDGSVTVDLFGGDYFLRARVRVGDDWSNLSNQVSFTIPNAPVRAPVIIDVNF